MKEYENANRYIVTHRIRWVSFFVIKYLQTRLSESTFKYPVVFKTI